MKFLMFAALVLASCFAHASTENEKQSRQLLSLLISSADQISYSYDGMVRGPDGVGISSILASALASEVDVPKGQSAYPVNTSSTCDRDPADASGKISNCQISFGNTEYLKTDGAYTLPKDAKQSQVTLTFKISQESAGATPALAAKAVKILLFASGI
jgi:hypothetical protein